MIRLPASCCLEKKPARNGRDGSSCHRDEQPMGNGIEKRASEPMHHGICFEAKTERPQKNSGPNRHSLATAGIDPQYLLLPKFLRQTSFASMIPTTPALFVDDWECEKICKAQRTRTAFEAPLPSPEQATTRRTITSRSAVFPAGAVSKPPSRHDRPSVAFLHRSHKKIN